MSRINNTNKYKPQKPIDPSDMLLGSDGKTGKTKNFLIDEILTYFVENNEGNLRIRENLGGAQSDLSKNKVKDGVVYYILNIDKYYQVYQSKLRLFEITGESGESNLKIRQTIYEVYADLEQGVKDGVIYYVIENDKYYKVYNGSLIDFTIEFINEDNVLTIYEGKINTNVGRHSQEFSLTSLEFPIMIKHEKDYSYIENVYVSGHSIPRRFWRHYESELKILDFTDFIELKEAKIYDVELKGTYFYNR